MRLSFVRLGTVFVLLSLAACPADDEGPSPDAGPFAPDVDAAPQDARDGGEPPPSRDCPPLTGEVVEHKDSVTADETWAGDGSVHEVSWSIVVQGATLAIAPCAVVRLAPEHGIEVESRDGKGAKLVARGTAAQPIRFERSDGAAAWGTLQSLDPASSIELAFSTLSGGGSTANRGAVIEVRGAADVAKADPMLRVDHVMLDRAASRAIVLDGSAAFTADSTELTIMDSGSSDVDYPVTLTPIAVGSLPTGEYSGNSSDAVLVTDVVRVVRDVTVHDRGIAYYWKLDALRVFAPDGAAVPTLTLEAGVEMRLDDYVQVGELGHRGVLLARGTAQKPVLFTSSRATPAAGDWPGIWLFDAPGSQLHDVVIDHAGGNNQVASANCRPPDSTEGAALLIGAQDVDYTPSASDFRNVTIANCAGHGINALWTADGFGPDMTAAFTFEALQGCRQTRNATTDGCLGGQGCLVD